MACRSGRGESMFAGNDLGFVGEICFAEPCWIEALWQQGGIPVLASLALGADGEYYNVNADEMAAACAAACHANALIFLTDVPGVKDAEGAVIPWLSTKQAQDMVDGIDRQRRHVAEAGSLPTGVEAGSGPSTDIAGRGSGSFAAVLPDQTELWNRGHLRMSAGITKLQDRSQS